MKTFKIILTIILFPFFLQAQERTWDGWADDGNWSNGDNWEEISIPTSSDNVYIPVSPYNDSYPIIDEAAACYDLDIQDGVRL